MSTPVDWSAGHVQIDVEVGRTTSVDVNTLPQVEVLVLRGRDGTGVNLAGAVEAYTDLPDDLGPDDAGKAYVVQDSGLLYVWSGWAWPSEENGATFRGEQGAPGRGITGITVSGTQLVFAMSSGTSPESVTVPAIQQAVDSAAEAAGYASGANTARLAAEAAAATAGSAASIATSAKNDAIDAKDDAEAAATIATTKATEASNSADAAAISESNAADSEDAAASSEADALAYRNAAQTAASDADTARSQAETARDDAEDHAISAQTERSGAESARDDAEDYAQAAAQSAADAADIVAAGVPNATTTTKGGIVLTGDLGGTWDNPTVPALANKADLGPDGKLLSSQIPAQSLIERRLVSSTAERLALTDVQPGDIAIQSGNPGRGSYILTDDDPSLESSWTMFLLPDSPVSSVNGYTGIVVLGRSDVGLGNVDNTSDMNKPVSTATQAALDGKLDKSATPWKVYATRDDGGAVSTEMLDYTQEPSAGTLAQRGAGGALKVGAATDSTHAVTKGQMDSALAGKANSGHTHSADDITSGTLAIGRLPVGTDANSVARGNDSRITGAVPNTRTISAGTGLTGGGALDANRTLSVAFGSSAGTVCQGNDARLSDQRTPTDGSVTTGKIANQAVTLAKLAPEVGVNIGNMIDDAVLGAQLITVTAVSSAYTLALTDANKAVEVNSASAVNVTIPTDATVDFPVGTVIEVDQIGAGKVTIVGATGVTVQAPATPTTRAQWSALVLRKRAADTWLVTGDMA
ncbi:tail protein [Gordonia phage Powerball]|uniref:Minor tail protein n=1 Tax=Gordonia phage Powerball TaxID=2599847 RepID=A0A5J6TYK1_9CAUD|nr:tail protein [Gordonia phage Powerball]QFG13462.1 minor tail protein [Gordonia phage Powerball]